MNSLIKWLGFLGMRRLALNSKSFFKNYEKQNNKTFYRPNANHYSEIS
jgi:hypothetical protein